MTAAQHRIAKTEFELGQMQLRFNEAAGNIHQLQHQLNITAQQLQGVMASQENQRAKLDYTATAINQLSSQVTSGYSRLEGLILSSMQASPATATATTPVHATNHTPAHVHAASATDSATPSTHVHAPSPSPAYRPKFMPELQSWSGDRNTFNEWYDKSTFALSSSFSQEQMEGPTVVGLLLQLLQGPAFTAAFPCRAQFTRPQQLKEFLENKFGVVHADTFNAEMCKRVAEKQHANIFEWERTFGMYADQLSEDPDTPNIDILSRRQFKMEYFIKGMSDQLRQMVAMVRPKFQVWTAATEYLKDVEMDLHRSKYVLSQATASIQVSQTAHDIASPMDVNAVEAATVSLFDDGVQVRPAPGLSSSERKLWYAQQTCKRCRAKGHTHISALFCKLHSGHANAVAQAGKSKLKASVHVVQQDGRSDNVATQEWVLQQLSSKE